MSLADLLIGLFLLFALVSWLGAARGQRRERRQDGEATPRAPLDREPAVRPGRAAPRSAGPLLSGPIGASPAGGSIAGAGRAGAGAGRAGAGAGRAGAGAGRAAVRRRAPLASALRHRGSLRRTVALMEVLDRRVDRDG
ncbi:hypothetical protein WME75_16960 [Sorangium sp. So ce1014]|uniref:hypothetical protein n=1 Tax=Sorangium sp. So ce1014 TaxID=3133326 RepID=UPI003F614CEA